MNKLSKHQKEILLHRLESGCVADCLADSELDISLPDAEKAVKEVMAMVRGGALPVLNTLTAAQLEVIHDCLDGCTFFGSVDDAMARGQVSKGVVNRQADAGHALAQMFIDQTGRHVCCVMS